MGYIIKDTDSEVQVRVYDCNNPGDDGRILHLTKEDGKITAWEYQIFKSVPTLKWGTGNPYNYISFTTSGNEFAEEMFSTEWLNINNEYHKLLTIGNDDINILSGEIKKMQKINSASVLPNSKDISNSKNLYWLDSSDALTFSNGSVENEIDIASEHESVNVNLLPNNTVTLFVSDTDTDYAAWNKITKGSAFTVDFCDYYESDDNHYVEKKTTISGISSSEIKAVNKSSNLEITGADSFTITTLVNDEIVDSKSIEANNHSVLISKNDDFTVTYKVDVNDDGVYDDNNNKNVKLLSDVRTYVLTRIITYTGQIVKPIVKVTYKGRPLIEGKDYELSYENAVIPGKATIKITGIGDFGGTVTRDYIITPAKVKLNEAKSETAGTLYVSWINDGMADGYEILLHSSRSRGYSSTISRFTIDGTESETTINDLIAGSRYTVYVRAYKLIDGTPVYGKFGASKSVTIKNNDFGYGFGNRFGWGFGFGHGFGYGFGYNPYFNYGSYGYNNYYSRPYATSFRSRRTISPFYFWF